MLTQSIKIIIIYLYAYDYAQTTTNTINYNEFFFFPQSFQKFTGTDLHLIFTYITDYFPVNLFFGLPLKSLSSVVMQYTLQSDIFTFLQTIFATFPTSCPASNKSKKVWKFNIRLLINISYIKIIIPKTHWHDIF